MCTILGSVLLLSKDRCYCLKVTMFNSILALCFISCATSFMAIIGYYVDNLTHHKTMITSLRFFLMLNCHILQKLLKFCAQKIKPLLSQMKVYYTIKFLCLNINSSQESRTKICISEVIFNNPVTLKFHSLISHGSLTVQRETRTRNLEITRFTFRRRSVKGR